MKTQSHISRGGTPRIGMIVLAAIFWTTQILACNFVSNALLFPASQTVGAIALGLFAFVFCLRLDRRSNRLAAILGGTSLASAIAFVWLVVHTRYQYEQVVFLLVLSVMIATAGIIVDARRWLRGVVKSVSHRWEHRGESHSPAVGHQLQERL